MRVLLFADVHANWEALLALQRAEPQPDAIVFAGDAVGYGPEAANCLRWLKAHVALVVRGNHDEVLLQPPEAQGVRDEDNGFPLELREAAYETLAYARRVLSAADIAAVRTWPLIETTVFGGARFFTTHGTPANPLTGYLNPATCSEAALHALFNGLDADVIVLGHTHVPAIRRFGARWIVNPGSLGQPRYGVPDATYAVWEDGDLRIRHLHYDHDATARKLRLAPLSADVMEQLANLLETGLMPE